MKKFTFLILITGLLLSCKYDQKVSENELVEIDAVQASPTNFIVLLDNEHVRVLEYTLKPGEKDEWHTHPAKVSYVVSGGKVIVHRENGKTIVSEEQAGTAKWMNAVGKHYVENTGETTVKVILTEVKSLDESYN